MSAVEIKKNRPYFVWDMNYDEDDIRAMLHGDDADARAWAISRIISHARYDDIWRYVTVSMIRDNWSRLSLWPPEQKEMWARALEVWGCKPNSIEYAVPVSHGVSIKESTPMTNILTPFQKQFLQQFFTSPVAQSFFLTGGTALAAFHLGHRLSIDVDLFTLNDDDFARMPAELRALVIQWDWQLTRAADGLTFKQFFVSAPNTPPLKVDLVRDAGAVFGEREVVDGIIVDSLDNIAANKVTAILGRAAAKDFVDLYFILQRGYTIENLITMAKEKDLGLTEFFLAHMMRQVERVKDLPVMLTPISVDELKAFFLHLADQLLAHADPPTF